MAPNRRLAAAAFCVALCAAERSAQEDPFMGWFQEELQSVDGKELEVTGKLPPYLTGLMVQPGPARFSVGQQKLNHAFDGYSKINRFEFDPATNGVRFSAKFLQSNFLKDSLAKGKISASILLAEPTPPREVLGIRDALGPNDNNYIKAVKIGDAEIVASDTMVVSFMEGGFSNLSYVRSPPVVMGHKVWEDNLDPKLPSQICIMASFAHGYTDPVTGDFISVMGCMAAMPFLPNKHVLFKIEPSNPNKRLLLAELPLEKGRRPSYMHSFGMSDRHMILIEDPLHVDLMSVMKGKALAQGALDVVDDEQTTFQVIDRQTWKVVGEWKTPGFVINHVVNAFEDPETKDIVLDTTATTTQCRSFFARFMTSNLASRFLRDLFSRGTVRRFRLRPDGTVEQSYTMEVPAADVELPKIHPAWAGKPYCTFFGVHVGANQTVGFESFSLVKYNICTGERVTRFEPHRYPSEHEFVPRVNSQEGTTEDDGVLVGIVYDGLKETSYLQVLDGKTLDKVAEAPLEIRVPFPVHTTWFPKAAAAPAKRAFVEVQV